MFNVIDSKLITWMQWFVEQTELFSNITRKDLIKIAIAISKWVVCALPAIITVEIGLSDRPVISAVGWVVIYFLCYGIYKDLKKTAEITASMPQTALPVVIVMNKWSRRANLIFITVMTCLAIYFWPDSVIEVWIALVFFSFDVIEYLLCTVSLPPGEKERRRAERELRGLQPQL